MVARLIASKCVIDFTISHSERGRAESQAVRWKKPQRLPVGRAGPRAGCRRAGAGASGGTEGSRERAIKA